jgi:hypothetical protein
MFEHLAPLPLATLCVARPGMTDGEAPPRHFVTSNASAGIDPLHVVFNAPRTDKFRNQPCPNGGEPPRHFLNSNALNGSDPPNTRQPPPPLAGGGAEHSDAGEGACLDTPSPKFSRALPNALTLRSLRAGALEFAPSREGRGNLTSRTSAALARRSTVGAKTAPREKFEKQPLLSGGGERGRTPSVEGSFSKVRMHIFGIPVCKQELTFTCPPPLAGGGKFEQPALKQRSGSAPPRLREFGGGGGEISASPLPQSSLAARVRLAPSRKGRGVFGRWGEGMCEPGFNDQTLVESVI